ncbi:hypothetical protein [Azospirillum sp. sgz302134]
MFSPDGGDVLFYSAPAVNTPYGVTNIVVKTLSTGAVTVVDSTANGAPGTSYSFGAVFSPDGSKVAFSSYSRLVPDGNNRWLDVYTKDLGTGAVTRVVPGTESSVGNNITSAAFSPDGHKIVFNSDASNLVPGDSNGARDVFVRDLTTGVVTRLSVRADGVQGNGASSSPALSPDGGKVLFASTASNLVPGDSNGVEDFFVKDPATGAVMAVTSAANGTPGNGASYNARFSPDGRKVAFSSTASNLVSGDSNGVEDVFVKDLTTGAVTRVSVNAGGAQGNGGSGSPVFSPDGSKLLFSSTASNLTPGDTNGLADYFVKDLTTGAVTAVTSAADGTRGNGASSEPVFSPDGRRVAFSSDASNLVPGDTNGVRDVFVKDLATGAVTRISAKADGTQGNGASGSPVFSPDGHRIAYSSAASNLVAGDTNGAADVFTATLSDVNHPPTAVPDTGIDTAETLTGTAGKDVLYGKQGNDTLDGNGGDDTLSGGAGNNLLDGGDGRDTALYGAPRSSYTITHTAPGEVTVAGPDGTDTVRNVEQLAFGDMTVVLAPDATPGAKVDTVFAVTDATSGNAAMCEASAYVGPVQGLRWQWIGDGDGEAVKGGAGNDFINSLGGMDAIDGGAGDDVLDGGTGSNFLTGGAGNDVFFVDGRSGEPVWSTVTDLDPGELVTVWGWQPGTSTLTWAEMGGADGFKGATAHIDLNGDGRIDASLTLSGKSVGSLMTSPGTVNDTSYLALWLRG